MVKKKKEKKIAHICIKPRWFQVMLTSYGIEQLELQDDLMVRWKEAGTSGSQR